MKGGPDLKYFLNVRSVKLIQLTDAQIENWRNLLVGEFGPYALIMPKQDIERHANKIQQNVNKYLDAQREEINVKYSSPTVTRLGHVAELTKSDIKCSTGLDFSMSNRWAHPNSAPWTHWTDVNTGQQKTPSQLINEEGHCTWQ